MLLFALETVLKYSSMPKVNEVDSFTHSVGYTGTVPAPPWDPKGQAEIHRGLLGSICLRRMKT